MYTLLYKLLNRIKFVIYKLAHKTYYKLLFGRRFPFEKTLSKSFHFCERQRKRGDIPVPKEVWESQYLSGHWKYMRDLDELPRYSIIAGYLQYLKPGGSVLDVGYGEGLLQQRLGLSGYSKYVGIDISETAINEASSRQDEKTSFICADAVTYTPNELFDVIVFNEALYYFDEPLKMVGKYIQYLNENGIFITCLYLNSERAASIWKRLKAVYNSLDEVKAANRSKSWIFNVFLNEHSKT